MNDLNILSGLPAITATVKVLNTSSRDIELVLSENLVDKYSKSQVVSTRDVNDAQKWNDPVLWSSKFYTQHYETTKSEGLRAVSSVAGSINDSIQYYVNTVETNVGKSLMGDTFRLFIENGIVNSGNYFKAEGVDSVYTLPENEDAAVVTNNITRVIMGSISGDKRALIDANGSLMPKVENGHLEYHLLKITNPKKETGSVLNIAENGSVRLDAVEIDAPDIVGIKNDGYLELTTNTNFINTNIEGDGEFCVKGHANYKDDISIVQKTIRILSDYVVNLENNGSITGDIFVLDRASLFVKASNIFDENGVELKSNGLKLYSGELASDIISTNGTVWIAGDVDLGEHTITGGSIRVQEGETLTSIADNINSYIVNHGGEIILTGGVFHGRTDTSRNSSGSRITIDGDVTLAEDGQIGVAYLTEGSTFTVEARDFGEANNEINVVKNSTVNLLGGTRKYGGIIGEGDVNIKGDLTLLLGWVNVENLTIDEGVSLTSNLDLVKGKTIVTNEGSIIKSVGGTLKNADINNYTGSGIIECISGTTYFDEYAIPLTMEVIVKDGATLYVVGKQYQHPVMVEQGGLIRLSEGTYDYAILGENGTVGINPRTMPTINAPVYGNLVFLDTASWSNLKISADNLNYANSLEMSNGNQNLRLIGGTLTKDFGINGGIVHIEPFYDVTFKVPVKTEIDVQTEATLRSKVEYLPDNSKINVTTRGHLYLGEEGVPESLQTQIVGEGYLNILGDITLEKVQPGLYMVVEENGILHTTTDLYRQGRMTNEGSLYLSGILKSDINGSGTTYIDGELELANSWNSIKGTLDLNNGVFITKNAGWNIHPNKLTGEGEWQFKFDWNNEWDRMTFDQESDAIIKIDPRNLAYVNMPTTETKQDSAIKRLLVNETNARLELLGDEFSIDTIKSDMDKANPDVYYDEEFNVTNTAGVISGKVILPNKDSIQLKDVYTTWDDPVEERADLLVALKNLNSNKEDRHFRFRTADDTYTMVEDGDKNYYNGRFFLDGVTSTDEDGTVHRSTIDANGKKLTFNNEGMNFKNVKFENVAGIEHLILGINASSYYLDEEGNMQGGIENVDISGLVIDTNTVWDLQSGIIQYNDGRLYQLTDSVFKDNIVTHTNSSLEASRNMSGGVLNLRNTTLGSDDRLSGGIRNLLFDNNTITGKVIEDSPYGVNIAGAVALINGGGDIQGIYDTVFSNNKAECGGWINGTLWLGNSRITTLDNLKFINNTITSRDSEGGGLFLYDEVVGEITNSLFENNTANMGSAIYFTGGGYRDLHIDKIYKTVFRNNSYS